MSAKSEEEEEVLSREKARKLAEACRNQPIPESLADVHPSLLSAEHIRDFVMATGLIGPFHLGGKKSRLKKASYEGRIGEKAYIFDDGKLLPAKFSGDKLYIPANSIVFVESDLDFRLPEYVALRFNLHIEHVHRGLLLGTGPLVDPGFWGKLCIPLHNLTSEDYEISRNDGLIWIEFTRTTSQVPDPKKAIGAVPNNSEYWDILKFIKKASKGVGGASNIPIQSSIGGALSSARDAAEKAELHTRVYSGIGIVGVLGLLIGGISLIASTVSAIDGQVQVSKGYVDAAMAELEIVDDQASDIRRNSENLETLSSRVDDLSVAQKRISELEKKVESLSAALAALASTPRPDQAPSTPGPGR